MGQGNVYISCNVFLHYVIFGENFSKLKHLYIQYTWISIMKKQNNSQGEKVEKMVLLVKTFDHHHHNFQLFQLSCKIVKKFETENLIEI